MWWVTVKSKDSLYLQSLGRLTTITVTETFQTIPRTSCCANWKTKSLSPYHPCNFPWWWCSRWGWTQELSNKLWWKMMCPPNTATLPEPGGSGWQSPRSPWKGQQLNKGTRGVEKKEIHSDIPKTTSNQRQNYPARTWTLQLLVTTGSSCSCHKSTRWHGSLHLLAPENLVENKGSLRREFEAILNVLGCWASHREFSKHVNTVFFWLTQTNKKVKQVSTLILPYPFWKTSVESEWVIAPLPTHMLRKKKKEKKKKNKKNRYYCVLCRD